MSKGHGQPYKRQLQVQSPRKNQEPPSGDSGQRANEPINASGMSASPPQINPSPSTTNAANQKDNQSHASSIPHWIDRINKFKPLLEAIGILFAIGYAFLTYLQWSDSHRAFKLDERPYIHVSYRKPDVAMNTPVQAAGDIGNVGKTFALNIHIIMKFEILEKDQEPHLDDVGGSAHTNETGMLIPNAAIHDVVTPLGSGVSQLSQDDLTGLTGGQRYISIHGSVEYSDLFGTKHWTRICQWFAYAPGIFQSKTCGAYNRVDNN